MGLLTGGLNGRRFRTSTSLPADFRDTYMAALREHAMVTQLEASDKEPRVGWVHTFDPSATVFELNDFLFDRYLVTTLRLDKKAVNATFLKIAIAERCAEVCEERDLERLTKDEQTTIAEAMTAELHRRAPPSTSTCDVAWDTVSGEVIVFSTSAAVLDTVRSMISDTFGVTLREERLADWLSEKFGRAEVLERIDASLPDARGSAGLGEPVDGHFADDPLEGVLMTLAVDFLTWLWVQSEVADGQFRVLKDSGIAEAARARMDDVDDEWNDITETLRRADITLWLESRLKLSRLGEDDTRETTVILGEAPTTSEAVRLDLQAGKVPVEACIGMKIGDLDARMTLSANPGGLSVSGVKLPFEVKTGTDEKIFERMMLLDLLHTTLKQLFRQFFLTRTSAAWSDRIDAWRSEELAAAK